MLCDTCQENVATVHLTEIVNKQKNELHLCEGCARDKGVCIQSGVDVPTESAAILKPPSAPLARRGDELSSLSCPVCGMTFSRFRSSGRLGCANDYVAFRRGLLPLLEKIHGSAEHKGRVPTQVSERLERRKKVSELREELNRAIQAEEYERAATLRDRIYAIEETEHA
jgi:protein arginine kinase activator